MTTGERVLSLAARLPAVILPFAVGLGLAHAGMLPALGAAAAALCGYWVAQGVAPWVLRWTPSRHVLLCTAVTFVVLSVLLIVAVEQQAVWAAVLLSGGAGAAAPPERSLVPSIRLERTAIGAGLVLTLICGFAAAWTVPLVAAGFLAATAVPVVVMTRVQPPKNSTTADL